MRSLAPASTLISAVVLWCALSNGAFSQPEPEPTPAEPMPVDVDEQLRELENTASLRAAGATKPLSSEEYSELVTAANEYASSVAGEDDAEFTRLASSALAQGVAAKRGQLRATDRFEAFYARSVDDQEPDAIEQVWQLPSFQENYRKLMEAAAKQESGLVPISGPPSIFRIVGPGTQDVEDGSFDDCVCVGRRVGGADQFCCTGTLVGKNVVVTAGHCFFCTAGGATNAVVYFGQDTSTTGTRVTGKAFRHPDYGQNGRHNDLAVIILDTAVTDTAPRRFATTDEIDRSTFVRAVGFGNSDFASSTGFGTKRMVDVPIASVSCSGENDSAELGCDEGVELVAGFVGLGPDSCNGDSGGPVYVLVGDDARDDSAWAIAGATSRATDVATRPCGDGGSYARLDKYLDFIQNVPGAEF